MVVSYIGMFHSNVKWANNWLPVLWNRPWPTLFHGDDDGDGDGDGGDGGDGDGDGDDFLIYLPVFSMFTIQVNFLWW